jgi:hypothetical protein
MGNGRDVMYVCMFWEAGIYCIVDRRQTRILLATFRLLRFGAVVRILAYYVTGRRLDSHMMQLFVRIHVGLYWI